MTMIVDLYPMTSKVRLPRSISGLIQGTLPFVMKKRLTVPSYKTKRTNLVGRGSLSVYVRRMR